MTSLPLSPAVLVAFSPAKEAFTTAVEAVEDAQRDADNARAAAAAAPEDAALKLNADIADITLEQALEARDEAERRLAVAVDEPVYWLAPPSFRTNGEFSEYLAAQTHYPSDRALFRAVVASDAVPLNDPDLVEVRAALKTAAGGVPDQVIGLFNDLADRASHTPEIRQLVAARMRFNNRIPLLKVAFFLKGVERLTRIDGVPVAFTADADGRAAPAVLEHIPPEHISAIIEKIDALNTLKGREKNVCASPSPWPSTPSATAQPETAGNPTAP